MRKNLLVFPLLAGLALAACGADSTGLGGNKGRLTINLTDSPGDLADAFITVDHITLIGTSDEGQSEHLTLEPEVTGYINLLDLAGGEVLGLVDGEEIPAGQYSELRIILDDAYVTLSDGRVFATSGAALPSGVTAAGELKCPSCSQSGFKVKFMNGGLNIDADEGTTVLLDFDVGQTFGHQAGQSGMWIMNPVLRATTNTVNFGKLTGTVTLAPGVTLPSCGGAPFALTGFTPSLTLNDETFSGVIDATGALTFSTLVPGTYTLPATATISFTNGDTLTLGLTPTPGTVTITDWGTTVSSFGYVVNSAVCTPKTGT